MASLGSYHTPASWEEHGHDHVLAILRHFQLDWLLHHFPPRLVRAMYVFVNGFVTIGLLAVLALITGSPFVFPSLGATAYLLFFSPLAETATPRNIILGHALGLSCGYAAFVLTGAGVVQFGAHSGIFWPRILAAALSLSATAAVMVFARVNHPPAGATALIVSLGIIARPYALVVIETAVLLLVAQALLINRLAGLHCPFWSTSPPCRPD